MVLKLTLEAVYAGYGSVNVLRNASLNVIEGEAVVLLGTNGNGKSTLLKCVMGLVKPTAGRIVLDRDGVTFDLHAMKAHEIVGLGVSMVLEGRRLFPKLSVEENLLLGAFPPAARKTLRKNLQFCYGAFPILVERRRQMAGTMSGGQQQMIAIARALMSSPRLLLIDEPSVGLSPQNVSQTISKIGELTKSHGLTVLMAEQNFHQATRLADRGYVIVNGEIVFEGRSVAELENNEMVQNYYLGA